MTHIYILEDQPKGFLLIQSIIKHVFDDAEIVHVETLGDALALKGRVFDMAFIDLRLPDGLSFDHIKRFKTDNPNTPVIVTTLYADDDMVFRALKAGADGYLLKSDGEARLTKCLQRIVEGEPPISPQIARKLMQQFTDDIQEPHTYSTSETTRKQDDHASYFAQLSKREHEVLTDIAKGMVTREIAEKLHLSPHTINDVIKSIYKKLNINSRAQATILAVKTGLI